VGERLTDVEGLEGAYLAGADGEGPGVLVAHAWWGLTPTFEGICDRLADAGFVVLAPDLYGDGRTASTIEGAEALRDGLDAAGALRRLRLGATLLMDRATDERLGAVGFSLGGWLLVDLAVAEPWLGALVLYYGTGDLSSAARSDAALLVHVAEADEVDPPELVEGFVERARATFAEVDVARHPGARHWFAEPDRPEHDDDAARAAWTATVGFLQNRLGPD
jgi:carboxymethylenebutenolidase